MRKTMKAVAVLMLSMVVVFAAGCKSQKNIKPMSEEQMQTENFAKSKGDLPWPVEKGFISNSFGNHPSTISPKITIVNNGIDIVTDKDAFARSVFDGEVLNVSLITRNNNAVIIRHGDYYTVYSQLVEVYVKKGEKVKAKQDIGRIYYNPSEKQTELHFELLHGTEHQDPALWLTK